MDVGSRFKIPSIFDRDLKLLLFSMSSRRISMGFLQVVRAIYFYILGFSEIEIGLLLSLATFVSALHHLSFGMLSDRFGRKRFLILGGFFSTLRMVIFATSSNFWMLALGQGVGALGEGAGAGQPVVSGYITDKTKIQSRAIIFSTLAISNALAATIGSLLASLPKYFETIWRFDIITAHQLLFWIGAFGGVVSLFLIIPITELRSEKTIYSKSEKSDIKKYSWGVIAKFSLVRLTSGLGWGFIESLLTLYLFIRFGAGGEIIGPIFASARFMSVFSYVLIPSIVDRFGDVTTIIASRFITAALTIAFSLATYFPLAIILLVALRIVIMFTMPIRQSFATGIVDPNETATAIGISNFARMSLRTVAPTAAAYMFEAISLSMPFQVGAFFLLANGLLFKFFFQPKKLEL
jgi:DHA1 family multidrug resistance protein-like MFS transporter